MTLLQLNYLAEAARQGSINQAANCLFVAQSSISSAIRELEDELGIDIFLRHNKGVRLTREGQALLEQVKPILEQEKKILNHYADLSAAPMRLNVSALHYPFAVQALIALLNQSKEERYTVCYTEDNIRNIIGHVDCGQSEIGIIFMSDLTQNFIRRMLKERGLAFHLIDKLVPHVFVRKGHPLIKKAILKVEDLAGYPYVVFDLGHLSSNYSEEILLKGFEKPKQVIHLTDRASVYNVLRHTNAYSIGSGILPKNFADEAIMSLPIDHPKDMIQLGYIISESRKLSSEAKQYIALLEQHAIH